ncbi:Hpt domain-containing protein [Celerinatantimonas yamalensis]|uniref:Hpt domain-containing protein n=1 Tax=Celerinatantimonas yamalensis TaxID=559956 RepID=A0ABW9GAV0_9GAMM
MQPLLCEVTLNQLAEDIGSSMLPELFNVFIDENEPKLAALNAPDTHQDMNQLRALFHTLKSSAASYGGLRLAVAATELDMACKVNDTATVERLLPDFIDVYTQTLDVMKQRY